jgi:hypothetical protein
LWVDVCLVVAPVPIRPSIGRSLILELARELALPLPEPRFAIAHGVPPIVGSGIESTEAP